MDINQVMWQNKKTYEKRKSWELVQALEKRLDAEIMPSGIMGKVWLSVKKV